MQASELWRKRKGLTEYHIPRRKRTNKRYYELHRTEILAHRKERYQANKESINKRRRIRYSANQLKLKYLNLPEKDKGIEVWQKMVKQWKEKNNIF